MISTTIFEYSASLAREGQRRIANNIKQRVGRSDSFLAARLDYSDDIPFLEPSLFTHFLAAETPVPLDQLLLAYLAEDQLPEDCKVYADSQGNAYLPRIGCVSLIASDENVMVPTSLWRSGKSQGCLNQSGLAIERSIMATREAEFRQQVDPLLAEVFRASQADPDSITILGDSFSAAFESAMAILERVAPTYSECIQAVTRQVILFRHQDLQSFATFSAHGSVFLNVPDEANEVFFVEDLVHQCGHNIFNAMTIDPSAFIHADPNLPLRSLTGDADEHRTLYVALHGVYTECAISICLYQCLRDDVFVGAKRHELLGRLSLILRRLSLDLPLLPGPGRFTPRGDELVLEFKRIFEAIFACVEDEIVRLDLRNQPYEFCYRRFAAANPV